MKFYKIEVYGYYIDASSNNQHVIDFNEITSDYRQALEIYRTTKNDYSSYDYIINSYTTKLMKYDIRVSLIKYTTKPISKVDSMECSGKHSTIDYLFECEECSDYFNNDGQTVIYSKDFNYTSQFYKEG